MLGYVQYRFPIIAVWAACSKRLGRVSCNEVTL